MFEIFLKKWVIGQKLVEEHNFAQLSTKKITDKLNFILILQLCYLWCS